MANPENFRNPPLTSKSSPPPLGPAPQVAAWPGIDAVSAAHDAFLRGQALPEADDAHWLLDFYQTFRDYSPRDVLDLGLETLSRIQGERASASLYVLLSC